MVCPGCGDEISEDALFCPHCGLDLEASGEKRAHRREDFYYSYAPMNEPVPEAVRHGSKRPLGTALCILAVLFAGCSALCVLAGLGLLGNYLGPLAEILQRAAAALQELLQ